MVNKNILNSKKIKKQMLKILEPLEISYVEIVDRKFNLIENIEIGNTIILVEVKVGSTRLLDNIWI
jgi:pantoate--beta-alanine ligase